MVDFLCKNHVIVGMFPRYDVVACLSEVVRNDTLTDSRHRIPKECRQHLKAQLVQQRENVEFDPNLKNSCQGDIVALCSAVAPGSAQVKLHARVDICVSESRNVFRLCTGFV